ncbi:cystathionine beta-lyase [Oryzicola mucosus]|uniref:Cystathionine beta-lyase n=1 Tax=Oryzicola mucosus TaxID=2767425 RepID=A0A8J6PW82_9HYPH|nr:cystathionine beta-lyase [Oryzicola mucosus]MBD0417389.1 cystathionine beta-lyase [Oryzicola mucosus]
MKRETKLLHYGAAARPGPANPPVIRASTILHDTVASYDDIKRRRETDETLLSYGRRGTTPAHALQTALAGIEGGDAAYLFPTGVAALAGTISAFLSAGDHALVVDTVFSPTRKLFDVLMSRMGVSVDYFPADAQDLSRYLKPNTRVLFLESPGSQTFDLLDVPMLTAQVSGREVTVIIDNTYGSGWLYRPLELGCHVSIIAGTKYLGGHADVMMGAAIAKGDAHAVLRTHVNMTGQTLAPDESYNTLRGMRTLGLRYDRHHHAGLAVAAQLVARPEVVRVLHPGLPDHPRHDLFVRDFSGAAGLFSVEFRSGFESVCFIDALQLFAVGSSWGGFESLAMPISPYGERLYPPQQPVGPMVRLHVGLEDPEDLAADIEQAFATVATSAGVR